MHEQAKLSPGQWHISDTAEGWLLRLRHTLSPREYARATWGRGLFWLVGLFATWALILWFDPAFPVAIALPFWVLVALFGWFYGKVRPNYRDANRTDEVAFTRGTVDVGTGVFDVSLLDSLREDGRLAVSGRVSLVFTGTYEPVIVFLGWPGVNRDAAQRIRTAVLERLQSERMPGMRDDTLANAGALTRAST